MGYPEGLSIHALWDEVAYHLDSTEDLLSLALTCCTFKDLIIPDHIEYRHIHCDIRRNDVWKHLENRPRLSRGIRSLRLLPEYDYESICLPEVLEPRHRPKHSETDETEDDDDDLRTPKRTLPYEVTDENLTTFKNSLLHMTFLKEFVWNQGYTSRARQGIIDISHVLTKTTHCLEALSMNLDGEEFDIDYQMQLENLSIWKVAGLKRVILRRPCSAAIQMILHLCPTIEDLNLEKLAPESFFDIMQHANWRKLRRLRLSLTNPIPFNSVLIEDVTISFFYRHTNLESLHSANVTNAMPRLPSFCLPNIQSFKWDDDTLVTSFLSNETISRLTHWDCPIDDVDVNNLPQLDKLETFYYPVPDDALPASFLPFLLKAPNLKKICLEIGDLDQFYVSETQEKMIQMFLHCPNLTHIFCDLPGAEEEKIGEFCQRLSVLRDLKILELNPEYDRTYVKLERDENGMYSGYQCVPLKKAERDVESWGDFFFSLSN